MKQRHSDCEQVRLDCGSIEGPGHLSRRSFLRDSGVVLTAGSLLATVPLSLAGEVALKPVVSGFTPKQRDILTAVTEHLFPKGQESPGATDIHAVAYLESAIFRPGFARGTRNFIINRAQTLQEASMERFELAFDALDPAQSETLLRYIVERTRWGPNWVSSLLSYILEALLSDPVYGGNPKGIGWQWLEHQPGFPRPPADKVYTRLIKNG